MQTLINSYWEPCGSQPHSNMQTWQELLSNTKQPLFAVKTKKDIALCQGGRAVFNDVNSDNIKPDCLPLIGIVPAGCAENLGCPEFKNTHNLQYAYVMGAMAKGICSVDIVAAAANNGMLGYFGAGGLSLERIEKAIIELKKKCGTNSFGMNLIHNPFEPNLEQATVELYLRHGVNRAEAAAFLQLTKSVVQYRITGLKKSNGQIVIQNHLMAKVSRSELARLFMAPPPEKIVQALLAEGKTTAQEAELAKFIPMADDISAEGDSGGHTDQRPLITLLPTFLKLRDDAMLQYSYQQQIRVGAGGGIATPQAVLGAFAMGAAYVLTGSINQCSPEAGISDLVKEKLTKIEPHDVAMAPSLDMFEMGVKLQVMKLGSMFPARSAKLFQIYQTYNSLENIPPTERESLEKQIFRKPLAEIWLETEQFFARRDPTQLEKAAQNPKHRMALVFRWYLGMSSNWAIEGLADRQLDYQVWTGPGMGAFNEWVKDSFMSDFRQRNVAQTALNLLHNAAILSRINTLKNMGINLPTGLINLKPSRLLK